ncbi:hypothetical protein MLD38_027207 [Melastoma candidum]|uniref:Uncharacterized protein n=1 Tax=Melastoma candidum TaxID=119954 RepID=A0ACB9P0S6_9MYRT|nr:hypothetical protein MLD38_027207 [Melastoma candidum]
MEADIPLPDELEWLEAQSLFNEEYLSPPSPACDDDVLDEDPPAPSTSAAALDRRKRPSPLRQSDSPKRTKVCEGSHVEAVLDDDDSWLRYSPPRQSQGGEAFKIAVEKGEEEEKEEEVVLSRFASRIDGDCVAVTGLDGKRVYAKVSRGLDEGLGTGKSSFRAKAGLLAEPINVLLDRSEKEAFAKALLASSEVGEDEITSPNAPTIFEKLWVDKYAPNSFTELLSDEQTNREVLLWFKQWDACVFGSEIRSTADEVLSALRRHSSITHHKATCYPVNFKANRGQQWSKDRFQHPQNSYSRDHDAKTASEKWAKNSSITGPPEQKVLLLCGPPGLGKTTLAHIAAKHCGYRVVEINASDDRSSAVVEAKILDVVQMDSVMGDSRPKCLIIDEIDGALGDGKGAVDVLLKMILAEKKLEGEKKNFGKEPAKITSKKRHRTSSLLRPVICICNDLYAPSLRQLRQVAKIHIFVQPSVSRVVSRLKHVCNNEGMKTSSVALTALAEFTECDIRSCLNTLQFLNKKKEALSELNISTQVVGQKDVSRNIFDIWKEIFQKKKIKRERRPASDSSQLGEFDALHSLISSRGDYDLLFEGIYENLLQLPYHDPVMQKTVLCLDSIGTADLNHQYMMRSMHMHLRVYQPSIAVCMHHQIAQVQKANIDWPKSYQRYRTMLMERIDTLRSWYGKMSPLISRHFSNKSLVEDSVSQLLHILSPPNLKPVAVHLLSNSERADLAELISKMLAYCVTYKSVDNGSKNVSLNPGSGMEAVAPALDPPLYNYITFKDHASSYHQLPIAMKQVLLYEVEKHKILHGRPEKAAQLMDSCNHVNKNDTASKNSILNHGAWDIDMPAVEKIVQKLSSSQAGYAPYNSVPPLNDGGDMIKKSNGGAKKSSCASGFFERFRKSNNTPNKVNTVTKPETSKRESYPVLFKFNEGFTNAIKRPVRMREFLL